MTKEAKFKIGQLVLNTAIDMYFIVKGIIRKEEGYSYILDNGSVIIDMEEEILEGVN